MEVSVLSDGTKSLYGSEKKKVLQKTESVPSQLHKVKAFDC